MQVSEQKDHITHAVLGGEATIDFGISNSAEFFNILSSTLYKDQILAVVREVLCNAWDAHIEAGCTDKPVEITLDVDKFVIKDFGKGIHKGDMGLIYGTYGNSTKKNDGTQTGGFGLGCKAPFAYVDHFEVQSNHDGIRTIYNLSKSSAQAMGKPGIVPIASFPTKDTGLQVSIPILNGQDYRRFRTLIHRIVRNGDMNMTLNGVRLDKLNFDTTKASVLITREDGILDVQTRIMVRYGNVIYPVDKNADIAMSHDRIVEHLNKLGKHQTRWGNSNDESYRIVFQAPPHSIAVTPSRESLSMQGHTVKTLQTLMGDFIAMLDQDFHSVCTDIATKVVDEAVSKKWMASLLNPDSRLPFPISNDQSMAPRITDLGTMARQFMRGNYPSRLDFRKKDVAYRLKKMVASQMLPRGPVQTFLRHLEDMNRVPSMYDRDNSTWFQKHVTGPLLGKLYKAGMDTTRLFAFDPELQNAPRGSYGKEVVPMVQARSAQPKHLLNCLPYLRNVVVLAVSRVNILERCKKHDTFKEMGNMTGFLFYHVGMKKNARDEALAFFNKTGMTVIDLTFKQEWEIDPDAPPPEPKKPPKKGVPSLKGIKPKGAIHFGYLVEDDVDRTEAPEFMCLVSLRKEEPQNVLANWDTETSHIIIDMFGDKGGITNNSNTYTKWMQKGARTLDAFMEDQICYYMMTSPTIREYWAFNLDRAWEVLGYDSYYDPKELAEVVYRAPLLRNVYGLVNNLSDEDKKYLRLWEKYVSNFRYEDRRPPMVKRVLDYLNAVPVDPANFTLLKKLKGNKLLEVIDERGMTKFLKGRDINDPAAKKVLDILTIILQ